MAELVDARDLKSLVHMGVRVRVPLQLLVKKLNTRKKNMFKNSDKSLVEYFKNMRRQPVKKIQAAINREDWDKVRALATHMKCPIAHIEQTLINFAVDVALKEYDIRKEAIQPHYRHPSTD